jgi:hypothetical protein
MILCQVVARWVKKSNVQKMHISGSDKPIAWCPTRRVGLIRVAP